MLVGTVWIWIVFPTESCDIQVIKPLLDFFGFTERAATELKRGTSKLRYSSVPFSKRFPSWPVPISPEELRPLVPVLDAGFIFLQETL